MGRCHCGGTYKPFTDGLTVEAGGAMMTQTWTEDRCDRCGCEPFETYEKCKEAESDAEAGTGE